MEHSIFDMLDNSGIVVLTVFIGLVVISVFCWAITVFKMMQFGRARSESREFSRIFWETKNFSQVSEASKDLLGSPLARVFLAGFAELERLLKETTGSQETTASVLSASMDRAQFEESQRLEKGLTFLATVASAAPFIGLFGTVWGIMNAFQGLSKVETSTIQAVAPGISEALIATAIGLAAAIPAAVAYNYFAVALKNYRQSMDKFSREFISIAQRYVIK